MRLEDGETTMSGFSFGGTDMWGYTSRGSAVRLARGTIAWELFDERHEGTLDDEARVLCATMIASNLRDENKNPIQRVDRNRVEALTGPKNAHVIPATITYIQIRSLTWPGVLTSMGDVVDCRSSIIQSPVTSISYKRWCSQTSKEEHETLSYEELQSLDDFELANVVIFGMVEVYKVLSTLLIICGGKIFMGLQVLVDTNLASQLLDFLPLRSVFWPFDRGREITSKMNCDGLDAIKILMNPSYDVQVASPCDYLAFTHLLPDITYSTKCHFAIVGGGPTSLGFSTELHGKFVSVHFKNMGIDEHSLKAFALFEKGNNGTSKSSIGICKLDGLLNYQAFAVAWATYQDGSLVWLDQYLLGYTATHIDGVIIVKREVTVGIKKIFVFDPGGGTRIPHLVDKVLLWGIVCHTSAIEIGMTKVIVGLG